MWWSPSRTEQRQLLVVITRAERCFSSSRGVKWCAARKHSHSARRMCVVGPVQPPPASTELSSKGARGDDEHVALHARRRSDITHMRSPRFKRTATTTSLRAVKMRRKLSLSLEPRPSLGVSSFSFHYRRLHAAVVCVFTCAPSIKLKPSLLYM